MFQKVKSILSVGNRTQWCLFICFTILLFIKCVLFHYSFCNSILISSLWKEPLEFFAFYLPKINISILLASFIFIFPNKWWTIIVALLIDLWCVSNLIYFRANELLLTCESLMMATNLKGFENSIESYWNIQCTFFVLQTLFYSILLLLIPKLPSRKLYVWGYIFILILLLRISTQICRYCYSDKLGYVMSYVLNLDKASYIKNVIPYREVVAGIKEEIHFTGSVSKEHSDNYYLRYHSIITYLPKIFVAYITERQTLQELKESSTKIKLNEIDKIDLFIHEEKMERELIPKENLIILIVESFESWLIESTDENDQLILPHINHFINEKANVYCSHIKSQVREGVSGDGQMILNTGLLPLQRGSAALLFGNNVYPNWAHFYSNSATIYSGNGIEWNQDTMTIRYNYQDQINPPTGRWEDETTMHNLLTWIDTVASSSFACQCITVSTHTPFVNHQNSDLIFSDDIPRDLQKYLNCFHYADSCIGITLEKLEKKGLFDNTVIIITGDHTIFKKSQLKEYEPYILKHHLPMNKNRNYVPLIIISSQINKNICITDTCYQMDIFPTILHLIGCEDYYWKGLGVNLLDSVARSNRPITEQDAYILSDKLIRANYFSSLTQ